MSKTKKLLAILLGMVMVFALAACGDGESSEPAESSAVSEDTATSEESATTEESTEESSEEAEGTAATGQINVISREEGSGTRGAFIEITGVEADDTDNTTPNAAIQNGTNNVMTYVAGDPQSIGYISMGSLNETVKAVNVDGVELTDEAVLSGDYPVSRPFNIVYKEDQIDEVTQDFINFILSKDGQDLAADADVLAAESDAAPYEKSGDFEGTIRVQGSTSVDTYMQALEEAYKAVQPGVNFDHTANGSGAGITAAIDGNADIGMASREIKQEELDKGLTDQAIAIDGIAVIVSPENGTENLTLEQIRQIFTGEVENWDDL